MYFADLPNLSPVHCGRSGIADDDRHQCDVFGHTSQLPWQFWAMWLPGGHHDGQCVGLCVGMCVC